MNEPLDLFSLEELYGGLLQLRAYLAGVGAPAPMQDLRGNALKLPLQAYHAALFARAWQGTHKIDEVSVGFPRRQYCEYDAYLQWMEGKDVRGIIVQLKELVPETISSADTLDSILAKAAKTYVRSKNLVLAVFINRTGQYETAQFPKHEMGGIFLYGFCGPGMLYLAGEIGSHGWVSRTPVEIARKRRAE